MVPSAFFDSFIAMEKPDYTYLRSSKSNIENMRNELVTEALMTRCTHLIMMDADQVYDVKTITRLLSHRLPAVGCLVYRRYPPFDPLMLKGTTGRYQTIREWEPESLVEVDVTGTGCILFDMDVFRAVPYPWFRFRKGPYGEVVGEDFGFCEDVRARGFKIYVDTSVPAGHLSQMVINEGTWKLYERVKEAELKAMHKIEHGIVSNTEGL
jgi:hypothetical protein